MNGEESQKTNERREPHINEQRTSIENINLRSGSSNLNPGRTNENSEILKQMKDMSEVYIS